MPIDKTTLESLQYGESTLISGELQGIELIDFITTFTQTKNQQITLHRLSYNLINAILPSIINNPSINCIIVQDLPHDSTELLVKALPRKQNSFQICTNGSTSKEAEETLNKNLNLKNHPNITCTHFLYRDNWIFFEEKSAFTKLEENKSRILVKKSLTYQYSSDLTIRFELHDYELVRIHFSNQTNFTFTVPTILPHCALIEKLQEFIRKPNGKECCEKLAINYFNGPKVDYLDFELEDSLTVNFDFLGEGDNEIIDILTKEGIIVCDNPLSDLSSHWLRDQFILSGNGNYFVRSGTISEQNEERVFDILSLNDQHPAFKARILEEEDETSLVGPDIVSNNHHGTIYKILAKENIKFQKMQTLTEGGNIVTIMLNNKIYMIMGDNSIAFTAAFRQQNNLTDEAFIHDFEKTEPLKPLNNFYKKLQETQAKISPAQMKEAKKASREDFRINQGRLIRIPNCLFHIDMFLSPAPTGVFLNSFALLAEIMGKYTDPLSIEITAVAKIMHAQFAPFFDLVKKILQKYGIPVVEVPGLAYIRNADNKYECIANFMNALVGKGKKGHFYITTPSYSENLNKAFEDAVKQYGVNNFYMVGKDYLTHLLLTTKEGSMRCASVPGSVFGRLNRKNITLFTENNKSEIDVNEMEMEPSLKKAKKGS